MLSYSKTLKCQPLKLFLLDLHFCSLACLIFLWHLFVCTVLAAEEVGLLVLSIVMPSSRWSSCGSWRHIRAEIDKAHDSSDDSIYFTFSETHFCFLGQSLLLRILLWSCIFLSASLPSLCLCDQSDLLEAWASREASFPIQGIFKVRVSW